MSHPVMISHQVWAPCQNVEGDRPRKVQFSELQMVIDLDLDLIRWQTGNQWSSCRTGVMWSNFLAPITTRAAAFWMTCNFCSSSSLTPVEVTLVCIAGRGLPTHQIRAKSEKLFVDWCTDYGRWAGRTDMTSSSRPNDDLKIYPVKRENKHFAWHSQ